MTLKLLTLDVCFFNNISYYTTMTTKYAPLIKQLREERGFSQSFIAERLEISRQSYMAIERGQRDLTLQEAEKLSDLYGISIEDLTMVSIPKYEKYKEMILAFLKILRPYRDGKVPKTKLAKMLYLADFAWYYQNFESMSGMQYLKRQYGPVPDPYFRALNELEEDGQISVDHKGDSLLVRLNESAERQNLDTISPEEITLIKEIAKKWRDKRTQEIIHFTHEQLPYKVCSPDESIPYELITQEDPDNVY
jgi:transcriptional regulator with XRE-family HTH domain